MSFMNYDLNTIVKSNHALRAVGRIISFEQLAEDFKELEKETGRKGYGVEVGLRGLFLQFFYDLSDREMEERLRYDIAFRWFCGMSMDEETPDHTYFCRIRGALGPGRISGIFKSINERAQKKGILRSVFSFVDASAVKSKETTWTQRDKALADGEEKLNNENVSGYSADKDARFGCKGKDKFWYGYKRHASVDMGSGLIKEVAATAANIPDSLGLEPICPDGGMVFCDKAYCVKQAREALGRHKCHSGAILKNNMKGKNRDKDRWLTRMRAPFESIFSKMARKTRYRGLMKVQFQVIMEAIAFNARRLAAIGAPALWTEA
jgi:transposase, IS5 family